LCDHPISQNTEFMEGHLIVGKWLDECRGSFDGLVEGVDVGHLLQEVDDGHRDVGVVVRQEAEQRSDRLELDQDRVEVGGGGHGPQLLDGVVKLDLRGHELGGLVRELDAKFLKC